MLPAPPLLANASDLLAPGMTWAHFMTTDHAKSAVMASRALNIYEKFVEWPEKPTGSDQQSQKEWLEGMSAHHRELLAEIGQLLCFANGEMHPQVMEMMIKIRAFAVDHSNLTLEVE